MQIQTHVHRPQQTPQGFAERPAKLLTSLSELSWDVFVQRRQRAQAKRKAFETMMSTLS